jgi:hypothetical protein
MCECENKRFYVFEDRLKVYDDEYGEFYDCKNDEYNFCPICGENLKIKKSYQDLKNECLEIEHVWTWMPHNNKLCMRCGDLESRGSSPTDASGKSTPDPDDMVSDPSKSAR